MMGTKYLLDTNVLISMFKNKGNVRKFIKETDILIGVTALHNGYTMVTANVKHLGRIPNLNVVNWE